MADVESVRGMGMPTLDVALTDLTGAPVDLTTAASVQLRVAPVTDTEVPVVLGAMSITSPATLGRVTYAWQPVDIDRVGYFYGQVVVTWGNGKKQAFPGDGNYLTFKWSESLGV